MAIAIPEVSARDFLPQRKSLAAARRASAACRGCPLWRNATQTVFGEGKRKARLMLVGEIPGDREDREGKPFVGPAGRLLDQALDAAGIDRDDAYVTNVVKHFKWEPRGRRRLHRTPTAREIGACLPWLDLEIDLVKPEVLICLGATAAKALLGRDFLVSRVTAGVSSPRRSLRTSPPRCIRPRCCEFVTTPSVRRRCNVSSRTCNPCGGCSMDARERARIELA